MRIALSERTWRRRSRDKRDKILKFLHLCGDIGVFHFTVEIVGHVYEYFV